MLFKQAIDILIFKMSLTHPIIKSFPFAFQGLKTALKDEPNFKIHLTFALIAIILGFLLKLTGLEWLLLITTIAFVIIMELVNTSLESIVNLVSPEIKDAARKAKDVGAAAVLVSAIFSVAVGLLLFLPKILKLF